MTRSKRDLRGRVVLSSVALVVTCAAAARGQCPDGTPPPCRSAPSAPLRRANPPLNGRAWIVVPFANVMKVPELDWLRDASVNLLTLDLSRWTDIAVVDDKRVGDLVRELPPARAAAALTLSDGLALARRAGAGTLVMGDFYKVGNGARIAANVFDVKTGNRLRAATQQAPNPDSLLTAFGPLARGVLALPPPAGTRLGATGTTSVDAYREFLLGSTALDRFELTDAVRYLRTSLTLDSTFALAHYKLSLAFHLDRGDAQAELDHAASAVRLGVALPPRERALLAARLASSSGDDPHACATLGALVARDSSDVEALYALGDCEYHGGWSAPLAIDSTHARFRGNWNKAVALFRRVLRLDPGFHPAFAHVLDILSSGQVSICRSITMACGNDPTTWVAVVIRDSDSLLIQPVRVTALFGQITRAGQNRSRYYNLRAAQAVARDWVDAGPTEARAHLGLAHVLILLGVIDSADVELQYIDSRADISTRRSALVDRIDVNVRMGRGAAARAALDSLRRETPDEFVLQRLLGVRAAALGHIRSVVPAIEAVAANQAWSPERVRYTRLVPGVLLGVPAPTLNEEERRYWVAAAGDSICAAGLTRCRVTALLPTLAYALQAPRTWWPPFITYPIGFRFQPAFGMALHRSDSLRASMRFLDSVSRARFAAAGDEQMTSVIGADVALVLHDSATALRLVRQFTDSVMPALSRSTAGIGVPDGWWLLFAPRMMLQRGDLAAAMGFRDEARTWYAKVLDLWSDADPELQPTVKRIRTAMMSPGATPVPNNPDFGPNVTIFDPSTPSATIQATLDSVFRAQESSEFGSARVAFLFKPGTYDVDAKVGFYTQVSGLGRSPDDVTIRGGVQADARWRKGNATLNFWRIVENMAVEPTGGFDRWAVSQAAPMRRMHIRGDLVLDDGGWSSGGFLADSKVDGQVKSGSQQQWLTRNSELGSWAGSNWNMVFVGTVNAPTQSFPAPPYTTVVQAPLIREKPFLYVDAQGAWKVFVPALRANASGTSWGAKSAAGVSHPLSEFVIVKPGGTVSAMNDALAHGKHLIITPGIYHIDTPLHVTRANTIVLGMGLATLAPDHGTSAITVDDVDGVIVAGLLVDAGATNSPILIQVGQPGSSANHATNPTLLSDVFVRVGGAGVGKATESVQVNSNNVIGDHLWLWRADHGAGIGWTSNTAANGLVVNGVDVIMYGLFVEHYQGYQVTWNGNGGRTYFFQNEMPYDVPQQGDWMSGSVRGFASYHVARAVTSHEAWGLGSYCFFNKNPDIIADRAFDAPVRPGVRFHDMVTVSLGGGKGAIMHLINDVGPAATAGATVQTLSESKASP